MSGITTTINDSGTLVDILGTVAVIIVFILIFNITKRKKNKEEIRHHDDKPEIWNLDE
jgi:uncharacterized membrane protein